MHNPKKDHISTKYIAKQIFKILSTRNPKQMDSPATARDQLTEEDPRQQDGNMAVAKYIAFAAFIIFAVSIILVLGKSRRHRKD